MFRYTALELQRSTGALKQPRWGLFQSSNLFLTATLIRSVATSTTPFSRQTKHRLEALSSLKRLIQLLSDAVPIKNELKIGQGNAMPFNALTVGAAVTPAVVKTYFSHVCGQPSLAIPSWSLTSLQIVPQPKTTPSETNRAYFLSRGTSID